MRLRSAEPWTLDNRARWVLIRAGRRAGEVGINQLILHHHYTYGSTFDVSTFGNHGQPQLVTAGSGPFSSSLHFQNADSRVVVAPSKSLSNPFAIAAMVRFYVEGIPAARLNLMEGFISFALFIEPSGALTGTIVDANGAWSGGSSSANLIAPGIWHEAWLSHDGISQLELKLDGVTVARVDGVYGPVRSVGDLGIAIGNWPDAGAYPFMGYIDEVKLYRYNPAKDFQSLLDPCCFNGRAFDEILRELTQSEALGAGGGGSKLLGLLARLTALLRGRDAAQAQDVIQLGQGLLRALQSRDTRALAELHRALAARAGEPAIADEFRALDEELERLRSQTGLTDELLTKLAKALCLAFPDDRDDPRTGAAR